MKHHNMLPFRAVALALPVFFATISAQASSGLSQQYCSTENTADGDAVNNIYQSNGACYTQCVDDYAFAVVQWQNCWCSNYIPADQGDTSDCNQECPGYPSDLCGNGDEDLYGYIRLVKEPSGTAGGSSSQASSTSAPTSSNTPTTSSQASSSPPSSSTEEPETSYTPSSTSSTTPTTPPSSSTSATTSSSSPLPTTEAEVSSEASSTPPLSATPSPVTSTRVVTVSGAVVTQTVTTTPMVAPEADASNQTLERSLSGGAIAGIVLGILFFLLALAFAVFLLRRRRRRRNSSHGVVEMSSKGTRTSPRRNVSVLSKAGLLARGHMDMSEAKEYDEPLHLNTGSASVRHSMLYTNIGNEGVSPVSPLGSHDGSRRHSRPMVYDQRLNPSALFANQDANGSRVSMQDGADYSRALDGGKRTLGIANPDPRASFESRISHDE